MPESEIAKKVVYMIPVAFLLALVIIYTVIYFFGDALYRMRDTDLVYDNTLLMQRFLNSESCFAYKDERIGRVYPGVIDLNKFNNDNLQNCANYGSKKRNLKLELEFSGKKITRQSSSGEAVKTYTRTTSVMVYDSKNGPFNYLNLKEGKLTFEMGYLVDVKEDLFVY